MSRGPIQRSKIYGRRNLAAVGTSSRTTCVQVRRRGKVRSSARHIAGSADFRMTSALSIILEEVLMVKVLAERLRLYLSPHQ